MNDERLHQERERAERHGTRRTILELLDGGAARTLPELEATMPGVAARVVPTTSPKAIIAYHLRVLHKAELVGCDDGVYRAVA